MELYQITIALALVMAAIEIFTSTFLFLGFGVGFLALVPFYMATGTVEIGRDAVVFGVATMISFVVFRKLFHHRGDTKSSAKDVNQY